MTEEGDRRQGPKTTPANKLTPEEKREILTVVNSPQYRDESPATIVPALADKKIYLASESTIYRILRAENQLAHRGKSKPATQHRPTPYVATAPNQVWSWDITYLQSTVAGIFFYLYLILDIYSRKIVGFEVHDVESSTLSSRLVEETLTKEGIDGKELVIHADNGGPMKGATLLVTLQNLGVIPSFSRPGVSDDNPFSESLFKTAKYQQHYPIKRFLNPAEGQMWAGDLAHWYNTVHLHSGIKFVTPDQRHRGEDVAILAERKQVYEMAKKLNPSRWGKRNTRNWEAPKSVRLNPLREIAPLVA